MCVAVNFAFWRPWAPASCHAPLGPGVFSHCSCPQMLTGGLTDASRAMGCSYSAALKRLIVRVPNRDSVGNGGWVSSSHWAGLPGKDNFEPGLKGRQGDQERKGVQGEGVGGGSGIEARTPPCPALAPRGLIK